MKPIRFFGMFSLVSFFGLPPCNKDLALNYSVTIYEKKKDKALQHKLQPIVFISHICMPLIFNSFFKIAPLRF